MGHWAFLIRLALGSEGRWRPTNWFRGFPQRWGKATRKQVAPTFSWMMSLMATLNLQAYISWNNLRVATHWDFLFPVSKCPSESIWVFECSSILLFWRSAPPKVHDRGTDPVVHECLGGGLANLAVLWVSYVSWPCMVGNLHQSQTNPQMIRVVMGNYVWVCRELVCEKRLAE